METVEEDKSIVRLFQQYVVRFKYHHRKRIYFQMLRSQMGPILDLILFLDQQYPWFVGEIVLLMDSLPGELEQNLQHIYKSTREYDD